MTTTSLSKLVMTELEVVNKMLDAVDIAPVASITGTVDLEVESAVKRFSDINRSVQTLGWSWNTKRAVLYTKDTDNEIVLGSNVLAIKVSGRTPVSTPGRYQLRESRKLYDTDPDVQSFTLTQNVYLDVVELLMFEDLPQSARNYISHRATREHERFESADDTKTDIATDSEMRAWAALVNDESETNQQTMEDNVNVYSGIFGRA